MGRGWTEEDACPTASGRRGHAREKEAGVAGEDRLLEFRSLGSLREAERYDCSCLIQTKYVTMFIKERGK